MVILLRRMIARICTKTELFLFCPLPSFVDLCYNTIQASPDFLFCLICSGVPEKTVPFPYDSRMIQVHRDSHSTTDKGAIPPWTKSAATSA
nr:MAG TPA: hypothetical protein [Caudoviricetes sp.]